MTVVEERCARLYRTHACWSNTLERHGVLQPPPATTRKPHKALSSERSSAVVIPTDSLRSAVSFLSSLLRTL